jgi:hypothetical protein
MATVNDLPISAPNPLPSQPPEPDPVPATIRSGSINKEVEPLTPLVSESGGIREVGADIDLPKEVASAGVTVQPTTVTIPSDVSQMGVTPVAQVTKGATTRVAMPLTDDQIAQGLKQSVSLSWRWLAEWCVKRLKQIHKTITGKGK